MMFEKRPNSGSSYHASSSRAAVGRWTSLAAETGDYSIDVAEHRLMEEVEEFHPGSVEVR